MKLPRSAIIVASYLAIAGVAGLGLPLLGVGPAHAEFTSQTAAFKTGAYTREFVLNGAFIVAGVGILFRKLWARKLAVGALAVATIYGGYAFAWGWAGGPPSRQMLWSGLALAALWNALWIVLLCRKSVTQALTS